MGSVIHDLDNDQLLILFVAGELPGEDRLEVEQMLATDAGLRASLATAQTASATVAAALAAADAVDPPAGISPSAQAAALRRVARATRQWQVDRLSRARPVPTPERQPRFPKWVYPTGVAAAAFLGMVAWWGWQPEHVPTIRSPDDVAHAGDKADAAGVGLDGNGDPVERRVRLVSEAYGMGGGTTNPGFDDAERQATSLSRLADGPDVPAFGRDAGPN